MARNTNMRLIFKGKGNFKETDYSKKESGGLKWYREQIAFNVLDLEGSLERDRWFISEAKIRYGL